MVPTCLFRSHARISRIYHFLRNATPSVLALQADKKPLFIIAINVHSRLRLTLASMARKVRVFPAALGRRADDIFGFVPACRWCGPRVGKCGHDQYPLMVCYIARSINFAVERQNSCGIDGRTAISRYAFLEPDDDRLADLVARFPIAGMMF